VTKKQDQQILNLQVKYLLSTQGETKFYYVKSEQESPTLYFSFLPQFAAQLKETQKGIVYLGDNFILGLIGAAAQDDLTAELEKVCKESSSKPVKSVKKNQVKFDYKIKGKKPVVTKEITQFSITGAGFSLEKVEEVLKKFNVAEMD